MNPMVWLQQPIISAFSFVLLCCMSGCEAEEPTREDSPEMITRVMATFTPVNGGETIVGTAVDPDADGIKDIQTNGPIVLVKGSRYTLTLELYNDLADAASDEYNIAAEVEEEADEHMLFFGWTGGVFADPAGDGNIDAREDVVYYEDEDVNGLPLGLTSNWMTAAEQLSGTLRILLKHQPDLKSETSGADSGETDLDIEFVIEVQ